MIMPRAGFASVVIASLLWLAGPAGALVESQGPTGSNLLQLHELGLDGAGVAIGMLTADNIRDTHLALGTQFFHNLDFTGGGQTISNHDTYMAGILASRGDPNFPGELGVAPAAEVFCGKLVDEQSIQFSWVAEALRSVVTDPDKNCRVVIFGLQLLTATADGDSQWTLLCDYYAYEHNVFLALAAGNISDGDSQVAVFGDAYNGLTVGGLIDTQPQVYDQVGSISRQGPTLDGRAKPELVAPGKDILTTSANDDGAWLTVGWNGETSFAAPHVAGLAALLIGYADQTPASDDDQHLVLKAAMINSAVPEIRDKQGQATAGVYHDQRGFGRIDGAGSYEILAAGEILPGQIIEGGGWAYQTVSPSSTENYNLDVLAGQTVVATVCWDRPVTWKDRPPRGQIDFGELSAASLPDVDMDLEDPNQQPVVQSADHVNNVEKLRWVVQASGIHRLRIENHDGSRSVDYGLAIEITDRETILGDLNGDGIVDWSDFSLFAAQWLQTGAGLAADFNGDQVVDWSDFTVFATQWLQTAWWYGL